MDSGTLALLVTPLAPLLVLMVTTWALRYKASATNVDNMQKQLDHLQEVERKCQENVEALRAEILTIKTDLYDTKTLLREREAALALKQAADLAQAKVALAANTALTQQTLTAVQALSGNGDVKQAK